MTSYPGAIKSFVQVADGVDLVSDEDVNDAYNEIEAIEAELGINPAGAFATILLALAQSAGEKASAESDIFYATAANAVAVLAKGTTLQQLRMNAGATAPEWFAAASDGWTDPGETWTYVSATTFTVPTDLTAKYQVGTKLKLTQTSVKYFHVESSSYSDPDTTVTVITQTDYTLANAAITSPFYSYQDNPEGFPAAFAYTPTITGYSTDPTSASYRFSITGRTVLLRMNEGANGTSDATTKTYTLPIARSVTTNAEWWAYIFGVVDNGASLSQGVCFVSGGGLLDARPLLSGGTWTASGNCRAFGNSNLSAGTVIFYEI